MFFEILAFLGRAARQFLGNPQKDDIIIGFFLILVVLFFPQVLGMGILLLIIFAGFAYMFGGKGMAMPFISKAFILAGILALVFYLRGV